TPPPAGAAPPPPGAPPGPPPAHNRTRRGGAEPFKPAEGDARAGALAVRLEAEQQDGEAFGFEELRPPQHGESVGVDAVQQHDRAAARPAGDVPALERGA